MTTTTTPAEGRCEMCRQPRPLFPRTLKGEIGPPAQLCARCYSKASRMSSDQIAEHICFATGSGD